MFSPFFLRSFILLLAFSLFALLFSLRFGWDRLLDEFKTSRSDKAGLPEKARPAPPVVVPTNRVFDRPVELQTTNLATRIVGGAKGARRAMDDVYQMTGRGLLDDSIRLLRNQLEISPANLVLRRELARLLLQKDDIMEATGLLVDVVDKMPSDVVARRLLARALYSRGAFHDTVVLAEWILAEDSSDLEARYILAAALFRLQRYDETVPHLRLMAENPEIGASVRLMLGQAYLRMGHPGRGIVFFSDSLKTNPKDREAYRCLAECYAADNQVEAVIEVLSRAVENIGREEVGAWTALPFMQKLRQDAQFAAFERRIGLEGYRVERPLTLTGFEDGELIEIKNLDLKRRDRR